MSGYLDCAGANVPRNDQIVELSIVTVKRDCDMFEWIGKRAAQNFSEMSACQVAILVLVALSHN
jgi:hypothetical protein